MIINPPFLPDGDVNQDQSSDDFVDGLMGRIDRGKFPVSSHLKWHGGVHLQAPQSDEQSVKLINRVPVRAIADGKVLYVRQPIPEVNTPHPLNNMGAGGWCDDGCVVIQHDTEIGEDLAVTFYSIYMHLKSIEGTVTTGSEIHRKGKIGQAGQIYGNEGLIHFEIVADETNTKKFLGDLAFTSPSYYVSKEGAEKSFQAKDGRIDACFGSMYFYIPKFVPLYEEPSVLHPILIQQTTVDLTKRNDTPFSEKKTIDLTNINPKPAAVSSSRPMTVGQDMYVEMAFDKGKCTFTSYDEDGKQIGDPVVTHGNSSYSDAVHEYNLYQASLKLYPSKPTAGFELLRFGRVIGDEDFAATEINTHFRKVHTPKGTFWIDLNNKYIKKYSDADFPYWKGWGVVNDDTKPTDGRSDSVIINKMIQDNWQKKSISAQLLLLTPTYNRNVNTDYNEKTYKEKSELLDAELDQKMSKLFCKFPTEWQTSDFDTRYDWVKKEIFDNNEEQFQNFKKHAEALAFWEKAGLTLDKNHWHFPPIEFIKHFRKCNWLSKYEIKQLIPKNIIREQKKTRKTINPTTHKAKYVYDHTEYYWEPIPSSRLIDSLFININKTLRKYCITTPLRMACFFGNSIQETGWLRLLEESGGDKKSYAPWYGRGLLQLTWEENYQAYWKFQGKIITVADHVNLRKRVTLANNKESVDSAGFYWVYQNHDGVPNSFADEPHNLLSKTITTTTPKGLSKIYYKSIAFWKAAAAVNLPGHISRTDYDEGKLGLNGFPDRCCAYASCLSVLTEMKFPDAQGNKILELPENYVQRGIKE